MNLSKLLASGKTVFTTSDLKKILETENEWTIRNYLSGVGKQDILIHLYYGIWGFKDFNIYEFACKLNRKSYISFETVLKKEGVIFQYYGDTVFLASDKSKEKIALGKSYRTRKLKDEILLNPIGVIHAGNYSIATRERAVCDMLYLSPGYHFDSLESIDWELLEQISHIYNDRVVKEVQHHIRTYAQ